MATSSGGAWSSRSSVSIGSVSRVSIFSCTRSAADQQSVVLASILWNLILQSYIVKLNFYAQISLFRCFFTHKDRCVRCYMLARSVQERLQIMIGGISSAQTLHTFASWTFTGSAAAARTAASPAGGDAAAPASARAAATASTLDMHL